MRFERLRLHGFKSFVDPTELGIAPGLTGIVGPNGCGKSNLLEALRWVMGEGSARSLRGTGMDDVIFAGTATRPQRGAAEVQLHLLHGDDEPLDIVRRIERGAGSAYRIAGRDARARDVALLFADGATGAHSPALVGQGRIGAIIAAKPVERRQMLEESAGIAGLHVRRREAETRLRATEANLETLGQALADAGLRAASLVRQARAAERYRAVSARVRLAEARLLYARWRDAAVAEKAGLAEAERAAAAVATRTAGLGEAEASVRAALEALAAARAAAEAARAATADNAHRLATLVADRTAALRRLDELDATLATLTQDRAREDALGHDAAAALTALAAESKALAAKATALEAALPHAETARAEAETGARDAEVALARAQARQAAADADTRIAHAARDAAASRLARADGELARLTRERSALGDFAALEQARATAIDEARIARIAAEAATEAIATSEAARDSSAAARDAATADLARTRAAVAALEAERTALVRALGTSPGDRLLDAVRAAPGAERALAAALGDLLDAPLSAFTGAAPRADDPPLPPGTVPLATLVDAPETLTRRLAQIALADDDDGAPLAVGQRLVTRAGHIRRWDGYRGTGDGAVAAEALVRRNRLDALDAERPTVTTAVSDAEARHATARAAFESAGTALADARRTLATAETGARAAAAALARADADLTRLAARRDALAERLAALETERAAACADHACAQANFGNLPDRFAVVARVATAAAIAEAARLRVARLTLEAGAARTDAATARARIEAAGAEARGWKRRAGDAAARIGDLDRRDHAARTERDSLAQRPAALAEAIATADAERTTLATGVADRRHDEAQADTARAAAEAARDTLTAAIADAREARAAATARAEAATARRAETGRIAGERFGCPAPVLPERHGFDEADVADAATESTVHERLVAERERIGPVNLVAEAELADLNAMLATQSAERDELTAAVAALRGSIGALNREGRQRLLAAFDAVDGHFRRLFATLFGGGEAHLKLIDADDPLEAGLEILAQPPGKRLQSLGLLSGGEQALTAVALIFALFLTAPAPVCVLDEVDAPLDDANIERFCDLLDRMAEETDTRYLVVTHNAVTMARMHRLYGVTMVEKGVSRLVSVDLGGATSLMAAG